MSYLLSILFNKIHGVDDMADNYYDFAVYLGGSAIADQQKIGYSRDDKLVALVHATTFDDTVLKSLHLGDDSTDYQNTTGKTVYVIVTVSVLSAGGDRAYKIWSAPTTDSKTAATEVFDSDDIDTGANGFDATGDKLTSFLVPIQDNHFIVIENTSGASSRVIQITDPQSLAMQALVIEPA